jgi:hypothetical protein
VDIAAGDLRLLEFALLGLVGVPLSVFFATTARLSAATRDRRLAALRLLGMSQMNVRRVNAFESIISALAGTAIGLLVYHLSQGPLASLKVGGLVWFPQDGRATAWSIWLLMIAVPMLAAAIGVAGSRLAVSDALAVRRQAPATRLSRWRLIPMGVGVAVLLGLLIASLSAGGAGLRRPAPTVMMVAILCTAFGIVLGFPVLAAEAARALSSRARSTWVLLAARRFEFEPTSANRVVAGLVVVVFGMGFATGLQRDAQAAASPTGRHELYAIQAGDIPEQARAKLLGIRELDGVNIAVASVPPPPGQSGATVGFLSCSALEVFIENPINECIDGLPYRVAPTSDQLFDLAAPGTTFRFPLGNRRGTISVPVPEDTLRISSQDYIDLGLTIVLPPDDLPAGRIPASADVYLASDTSTEAVHAVVTRIAEIAPLAELRLLNDDLLKRHQSEVFQGLLSAALILGIMVGVIAFIVGALDRAMERRANLVSLRIVGVPTQTLRAAQAMQVVLPLGIGAVLAIGSGQLAEQVTVSVGGFARGWNLSATTVSLAVSLAAVTASIIATVPAISTSVDASLIRRE